MADDFNVRNEKPPSEAVLEARTRRLARATSVAANTKWFIDEVCDKVAIHMKKRVRIATELVRSQIVLNISRPVTKTYFTRRVASGKGFRTRSQVRISDRSVPGEFPKADTTQLMKTIFSEVKEISPGNFAGYVGTPLDYGLILELEMNRSFMVRTLYEQRKNVIRILSGPIT